MEQSKNTFKYLSIGLAVLVVILAVIVAFLLGQRSGEKKNAGGTEEAPGVSASISGTINAVPDTAGNSAGDFTPATGAAPTELPAADAPRNLDIDMAAGSLDIVKGDAFHVQYDDSVVSVTTEGDSMHIETTPRHPTASERRKMKVTVTVPDAYAFSDVEIEVGAGKLTAQTLRAETLELELGAGSATLNNLFVSSAAKIEEGAGELGIRDGEISNLTLECGAGAASVSAKLIGSSRIDAAAGAVDLNLKGDAADYTVTFGIGLGACYYNNEKLARSGSFGEGQNRVTINGGLGVMRVAVN